VLIVQLEQLYVVTCDVTNVSLQLLLLCASGGGRAHVLFEMSPATLWIRRTRPKTWTLHKQIQGTAPL